MKNDLNTMGVKYIDDNSMLLSSRVVQQRLDFKRHCGVCSIEYFANIKCQ